MTDDETRETDDIDDEEAFPDIDDPFAELGDGIETDGEHADSNPDHDADTDDTGPLFGTATRESTASDNQPRGASKESDSSSSESIAATDPFDDLETASERDIEDAFERMDVGDTADEDVWKSLDEDLRDSASGTFDPDAGARPETSVSEATEPLAGSAGGPEHVVDKRTYCQQCPHLSDPPDVACTHEGTTIVEVVNTDEFRVWNCPMVSEEDPAFDEK